MSGPSSRSATPADDGWGSATTIRSGTSRQNGSPAPRDGRTGRLEARITGHSTTTRTPDRTRPERAPERPTARESAGPEAGRADESPAARAQRPTRAQNREARRIAAAELDGVREAISRPHERGLPGWAALLVMLAIAVLGGIVDTVDLFDIQGGFNVGIVVASVVAIVLVKRSHMFPVVIAPPIVYTLGAGFQYYVKASGSNANKAKIDAAANYLVYGFPAIATACAAVLIIAGVRMIVRK
ncbi:DUF6542 domain-containing protein [Jatrophihabitans fulvus]